MRFSISTLFWDPIADELLTEFKSIQARMQIDQDLQVRPSFGQPILHMVPSEFLSHLQALPALTWLKRPLRRLPEIGLGPQECSDLHPVLRQFDFKMPAHQSLVDRRRVASVTVSVSRCAFLMALIASAILKAIPGSLQDPIGS